MISRKLQAAIAGAAFIVPLFASSSAHALQSCGSLKKLGAGGSVSADDVPEVIYVTGSSAVKPLIASLAPAIFAATTQPATIVYLSQTSCAGVTAVLNGGQLPSGATANYWDSNSLTKADASHTLDEENCTVDAGTNVDIGVSDVFAETCGVSIGSLPVGDFQGPIQSMTFAANLNSSESAISAEAAYLTMAFHSVAPWIDKAHLFRRDGTSGTQLMIGAAINVPGASWTGVNGGTADAANGIGSGSQGVYDHLSKLISQNEKDESIGVLAADFSSKPGVKQLAYQHYGQRCGYKPDVTGLDKKNTRTGKYAIWGPLHFLTQKGTNGLASRLAVRNLISYVVGSTPPPLGVDLISTEATLHVVPPCAMSVSRTSEMGPMSPATPPSGGTCNCAFDKAATGTTTCQACKANQDCTGGTQSCNFGFCE